MLPLRDDIPSRTFPAITLTIILANVLVFLFELGLGPRLNDKLLEWAIIPALYTEPALARQLSWPDLVSPFFSSMFLHGGWIHLIGNMWTLWIFGDNVEDRMGRWWFLGFYLASGVAAGAVHIFTNAGSVLPTIGASGAVAGVMGAYFRFYPHARVETLIPPFFLGPFFELPAVLFLGWWMFLQFFNGTLSLMSGGHFGGVAWWAHVGGFLFGLGVGLIVPRVRVHYQPARSPDEDRWP